MPRDTEQTSLRLQRSVYKSPLKKGFIQIYSTGQIVEQMILGVVAIFLLIYLTSVCGLEPDMAGLVLFISLSIDAVVDPLIGATSDGWKSRWGRRHPFMLVGLTLLSISIIGLFILPAGLPTTWIFVYVLVFNILMRVSNSLFILPYAALLAEFSSDYEERSRIMIYRLIIGSVAWAVVYLLSFRVFFKDEDALSRASSYIPFALLVVGIIIVSGLIATFGTLSAAKRLHCPPDEHSPISQFFREVMQLFRNSSFVCLFFGVLVYLIAGLGFVNSISLHTYRYYWNLTPEQMQIPTVIQPIGMIMSIPLAMWLVKVIEKRTMMLIAIGAFATAYGVPPLLRSLGLLASEGLAPFSFVILSGIVYGVVSGLSFVAFGSMVADAVDEHDFLFGARREGLYFASLVFAAKAALGLGGMLAGFSLKAIGFPSDPTSPEGAAQLTPQVINMLGLLWGPVFAIGILLAVPFFLRYQLDRKAHQKIVSAITARNAACQAS